MSAVRKAYGFEEEICLQRLSLCSLMQCREMNAMNVLAVMIHTERHRGTNIDTGSLGEQ